MHRDPPYNDSRDSHGIIDTDVNVFLSTGISSVLSPWRLAATAVQLQFGLRQLGRALACESTKEGASASLDKMTSLIFHHSMALEEAYFIAEMARGVDGPVAIKVSDPVLAVDTH